MATKGRSKPERRALWQLMTTGLEPQLGELPLLVPLHTELKGIILQSEELDARQAALKAETQEPDSRPGGAIRDRLEAASPR